MSAILRLDKDFERILSEKKKGSEKKAKRFLVTKYKFRISSQLKIANFLIEETKQKTTEINAVTIRKKMLELTLNFLEPLQHYFQNQYNVFLKGSQKI